MGGVERREITASEEKYVLISSCVKKQRGSRVNGQVWREGGRRSSQEEEVLLESGGSRYQHTIPGALA